MKRVVLCGDSFEAGGTKRCLLDSNWGHKTYERRMIPLQHSYGFTDFKFYAT